MYNIKFALFQVYTYSGLLLLILLAEFGAGIAALVFAIFYLTIWYVSYNLVCAIYYLTIWYVPSIISKPGMYLTIWYVPSFILQSGAYHLLSQNLVCTICYLTIHISL